MSTSDMHRRRCQRRAQASIGGVPVVGTSTTWRFQEQTETVRATFAQLAPRADAAAASPDHRLFELHAEVREAWVCVLSLLAGALNVQVAPRLSADPERTVLTYEVMNGKS